MAVACLWQHVHVTTTTLSWDVVPVDKPDDVNVVIGQARRPSGWIPIATWPTGTTCCAPSVTSSNSTPLRNAASSGR